MNMKICKFGGSSLGESRRLEQILDILQQDSQRRCVVVSAPGKASDAPVKVTDLLIRATEKRLSGATPSEEVQAVRKRYHDVYDPLGVPPSDIDEIMSDLDVRLESDATNPGRFRDLVAAAGEALNARAFAAFLDARDIPAVAIDPVDIGLTVTTEFGNARPLDEASINLANLKKTCAESIVVFPGFFGVTAEGDVATFSRGGSDLTGALLAEALDAVEYENWTDVDGIFSASPKIVDEPEQIAALTYREMRELSYIGFNVLHQEAVWPAMRRKIPIRLRNTMNLDNRGTLIVSERLPSERDVIGIASGGDFCTFTLQKYLMNREKGFGRKLLSIIEDLDLSYEHCPSSVDSISVVLAQDQLEPDMAHRLLRAMEENLSPDEVTTEYGIALIAVVGEGLNHKIGVLGSAADALSAAGVNIKLVNQGSSEISIIFGVDVSDEKDAVRALYQRFFPAEP
ncbi:MAG: aspartate kinase [Verrucomicrobiota bacterium]